MKRTLEVLAVLAAILLVGIVAVCFVMLISGCSSPTEPESLATQIVGKWVAEDLISVLAFDGTYIEITNTSGLVHDRGRYSVDERAGLVRWYVGGREEVRTVRFLNDVTMILGLNGTESYWRRWGVR